MSAAPRPAVDRSAPSNVRRGEGRTYDPRDPESILAFAKRAVGLTIREISSVSGRTRDGAMADRVRSKGFLGDVMEAYFGIPRNNSPEPDFPAAGVEMKIVPLRLRDGGSDIKEPTSICMIDYMHLVRETWASATVRKKLERVLFIFISVKPEDLLGSTVRGTILWSPTPSDLLLLETDWTRTWKKVGEGRAHELSESQAVALAARRKGAGGPRERGRPQPRGPELAKSRAWALKTGFTRQILKEWILDRPYESALPDLPRRLPVSLLGEVEQRVRRSLGPYVGLPLSEVARINGVRLVDGKNLAASVVKRSLGFKNVNSSIREFEQFGIDVKTLNLRSTDGRPFEAVSFPAVDLRELAQQEWEGVEGPDGAAIRQGSELAEQLHLLLFVPTFSPARGTPQARRTLGAPFFWEPTDEQRHTIETEWRMFRDEVAEGRAAYVEVPGGGRRRNRLTPESRTKILHMRPHGRDASDVGQDPLGNYVTKQSFWLNKRFVWDLVRTHAMPDRA